MSARLASASMLSSPPVWRGDAPPGPPAPEAAGFVGSEVRGTPLLGRTVNRGKKKAGPPFLGGGMRRQARPHNGIVIQASIPGEHPSLAVTRYSAVCAAHPLGERTSENPIKPKFAGVLPLVSK